MQLVTRGKDMKRKRLKLEVEISPPYLAAYKAALTDGDLAALKTVLLEACDPEEVAAIEQMLPAELVYPV